MARLTRRDGLVLAGLAALALGWQRFGVRSSPLQFEPIAGLPGWQFATAGPVTGPSGTDFLTLGLPRAEVETLTAEALEPAVFSDRAQPDAVPVAVFGDFFCPHCRGFVGLLTARRAGPPIEIFWHELPLLGPNSALVARAAEAANVQGGYAVFYQQLIRDGFRPLPQHFAAVAERAGLDGDALLRDMDGDIVAARLATSAAAAATLGIAATPGLVIGRNVVLGAVERDMFEALVDAA